VLGIFVLWQARNPGEPLVRLALFRDRNFSLSNVAITTVSFAVTAMAFPMMFYAQGVMGLSPTRSALLLIPMAVFAGGLAPWVGRLIDRVHPRWIAGFGLACMSASLFWLAAVLETGTPVWQLLLPIALLGIANAFAWAPLATTATRNLPMADAGSGAGIYNATRQIGAVLGSAAIAVVMQSRLAANLPAAGAAPGSPEGGVATLPASLHEGFSAAMSQSLLLPASIALIGFLAALGFTVPRHLAARRAAPEPAPTAA